MKGRVTQIVLRALDSIVRAGSSYPEERARHLVVGAEGEETAHFYLRQQGYVIVAKNFRSPRHRGEIDLIGWDGDVLCFIEVKTRRERSLVPAEMAVDGPKQSLLRATAKDYLRRIKAKPPVRFDVVVVYYQGRTGAADITLFKNSFGMS
jgi:putative endonuclease